MRERIMMALIMVSVSITSALVLAGVNYIAAPIVKKNEVRKFRGAVLSALAIPYDADDVETAYQERISERPLPEGTLYLHFEEDASIRRLKGAAFEIRGPAFWGPMTLVLGVDPEELTIIGMEVLEQHETPGLGARIEEKQFTDQFKGKKINEQIIVQIKGARPGPNDVSAVTGATITSKSLEAIIRAEVRPFIDALRRMQDG